MQIHSFTRALFLSLVPILSLVAHEGLHAQETIFDDDFSGVSLDQNWTPAQTPEAMAPKNLDNTLVEGVTTANSSVRSLVISKRSDFDPFQGPLTIVFDEVTIQGSPMKNGYSGNLFYAFLGNINNGQGKYHGYNPWQEADTAGYLAMTYEKCLTTDGVPFWRIQVIDRAAKATIVTLGLYGTKTPTSIEWTVDGPARTWKIALIGGATFYTGNENPGVSYEENKTVAMGNFEHFTADSVSGGSYLALGGMNHFEVTEATKVELAGVKVLSSGTSK